MRIQNNIIDTTGHIHKPIPIALDIQKYVMDHNCCVCIIGSNVSPAVVVEPFPLGHVVTPVYRLIEEFDSGNDVGLGGVTIREGFDC